MPAAFHEIRLPTDIAPGMQGGPMFSTVVTATESGGETRIPKWSFARRAYTIGHEGTDITAQAIENFFMARLGRAYGWRLKVWNDYKAVFEVMAPIGISGVNYVYQMQKTYVDAINPIARNIIKPNTDITPIIRNVTTSTTLSGGAYSIDYTTGRVTIFGITSAQTMQATFNFDTPVRFDTDRLEYTMESPWHRVLVPVPVVELLNA